VNNHPAVNKEMKEKGKLLSVTNGAKILRRM
jgi:hypothetical protein